MPYDIGDSVPIAWDVRDSAGVLTNATGVVLAVTLPDGTTATPTVPAPAVTGQYRVTYVPAVEGRYLWRVVMTGPNTAYGDVFDVREAASPALLSLADTKRHLRITDTSRDDQLREYIEAATEIVESYVGPIVTRTHVARVMGFRSQIPLPHTQVTAITNITIIRTGTSPIVLSNLSINTPAGVFGYKNLLSIPWGEMDVTYTVGRPFVKANWTMAAEIIVQHIWQSQLGNLPSMQGDDLVDPRLGTGYLVPFRAISLLQPDQVPAGFA